MLLSLYIYTIYIHIRTLALSKMKSLTRIYMMYTLTTFARGAYNCRCYNPCLHTHAIPARDDKHERVWLSISHIRKILSASHSWPLIFIRLSLSLSLGALSCCSRSINSQEIFTRGKLTLEIRFVRYTRVCWVLLGNKVCFIYASEKFYYQRKSNN